MVPAQPHAVRAVQAVFLLPAKIRDHQGVNFAEGGSQSVYLFGHVQWRESSPLGSPR